MASDCSPLTAAGFPLSCSPTTTGYNVRTYTDSTTFTVSSIEPPLIPCAYETGNAYLLGWTVLGVLAVAYFIKLLVGMFK
jgi:hypothetical protein